MPEERIYAVMSGRFRFTEWDGDASALTSALETAIDQHWYVCGLGETGCGLPGRGRSSY